MNSVYLVKAIHDPEVGEILKYAHQPYMARVAILKVVDPYVKTGHSIPEHLAAGLNSHRNEDIVPNVVSTFITNLEVENARSNKFWSKIDVGLADFARWCVSGVALLRRHFASYPK